MAQPFLGRPNLPPLPDEVSELLDGYRNDWFVKVGDTLVVVDNSSWRVVAIIPRE